MPEHEGFDVILSLDGRSSDFVLGVEAGRLWEQLKHPAPFEQTIHAENLEIVMRMREATGRDMRVEDSEQEEWCFLVVGAVNEAEAQLARAKQLLPVWGSRAARARAIEDGPKNLLLMVLLGVVAVLVNPIVKLKDWLKGESE